MLSQNYIKNSKVFSHFFPSPFPIYGWHTPLNSWFFWASNFRKPSDFFVHLNILPLTDKIIFSSHFAWTKVHFKVLEKCARQWKIFQWFYITRTANDLLLVPNRKNRRTLDLEGQCKQCRMDWFIWHR